LDSFSEEAPATKTAGTDHLYRELARDELLDHLTYDALARRQRDPANRNVLARFSTQEREHFEFWARLAGAHPSEVSVPRARLYGLLLLSRILGFAFTIRQLERGEAETLERYDKILSDGVLEDAEASRLREILEEERAHEREVERNLSDERVAYLGSAVLGLNDALIELTGGLTGLVSSISDPLVVGFSGLVVGIAASMSMAASNFLSVGMSSESDGDQRRPLKSALYTGVAYIVVVLALVAPFFVAERRVALACMWAIAVGIIAAFSYYSSVVLETSYRKLFAQMLGLGLGVAVITFAIGKLVSGVLGISV
jgi:vacuolar iron transporter family protein